MRGRLLFSTVVSVFLLVQVSYAQTSGTISGFVQDESKAVLPGVDVQAVQEGTALTRTVVSTETGAYTIPLLPPGKYTVTFSLPGFQTVTSKDITVNATERVTVNATLPVAGSAGAVDVSAAAQLVQAETT